MRAMLWSWPDFVPAIHVFPALLLQDVDARHRPGMTRQMATALVSTEFTRHARNGPRLAPDNRIPCCSFPNPCSRCIPPLRSERRCKLGFRRARRADRGFIYGMQEASDESDAGRTQGRCGRNRMYNG